MNLMKKIAFTAAVLMVFAAVAGAASVTSDYAGEAMSIGVGARALGMGGTFAGIADDASTSYWNPAGMTQIQGVEVSSVKLAHINDLETNYSYVNLVYNAKEAGAFGIGWLRQAITGILLTDSSGNSLTQRQETSDNAFYLAYAYPVIKGFSIGLTIKALLGSYPYLVSITQPGFTSYNGFGLDMGVLLNLNAFVKDFNLSIGCNVQDIYTVMNWDAITALSTKAITENVGYNIKPGISYKLPVDQFEFVAASDIDTRYDQLLWHIGGEVWWNKMVAIRGGYKTWGDIKGQLFHQVADWSVGASLRWYFIGVDYTYVYNELTDVQYLSIIGKF
jgi:hypothetical protein